MPRLAAWLLSILFLVQPNLARAEPALTPAAKLEFEHALALLQDPTPERLAEAYQALSRAEEQSSAWQLYLHLGFVAAQLERPGEAILAYEAFLKQGQGEIDPEERARVERDLAVLQESTSWLTLHIRGFSNTAELVDTRERSDGEPIRNTYKILSEPAQLGLSPGRHRLSLRGLNGAQAELTLDLQPGTRTEPRVALTSAPPRQRSKDALAPQRKSLGSEPVAPRSLIPFYVSASLTGVVLTSSVLTGLSALEKRQEYERLNDGSDPQRAAALRDQGTALNTTTDVLLGLTALGGVVSAILYENAVRTHVRKKPPPREPPRRTILGIQIGTARTPTPKGITFSGTF